MKPDLPRLSSWVAALATGFLWQSFASDSIAQPSAPQTSDEQSLIGTRLVDFVDELRSADFVVIYSSALVPDSLRLTIEPTGRSPRRRLRSVLETFGLSLERGPQDTWLIVRSEADRNDAVPEVQIADPPAIAPMPPLENVIVTASRYAFARDPFVSGALLDRLQIDSTPSIGDDALRPVANVPGVSGNGLSSRTTIRGGALDETQVLFDGVELSSPFHLKDFESVFGSISPRIVERMDVHTGGFSAKYGNRMSGVIEIQPIEPAEPRHVEVGVSTINTSLLSSGRFAGDRSSWLVSLRRGNVDLLLDAANSDFGSPQFTDFYTRITTELSRSVSMRIGAISLNDKINLNDANQTIAVADYDDGYLWIGFNHRLSDSFTAEYLFALAGINSYRSGTSNIPDITTGSLQDRRSYSEVTARGDWSYRLNDRHLIEWGLRTTRSESDYEFLSELQLPLPISSPLTHPGTDHFEAVRSYSDTRISPYVNYRWQANREVIVEVGTRFDDRSMIADRTTSPRIGAVWDVTDNLALRASWGEYRQSQNPNEIQLADRDLILHPIQHSIHRLMSLEYNASENTRLRVELFKKQIRGPRPRFENLFTRLSLLPELLPDRVQVIAERARASGIEISLDSELRNWRWWFGYSRSDAEDLISGVWTRRSWQETWSGKAGFIKTMDKWTLSTSMVVRSGWPISTVTIEGGQLVVPAMNDQAFEKFRSVDFKASRLYQLGKGSMELYFELINALNDNNFCCFEHVPSVNSLGQLSGLATETQQWLPSVPVVGFRWSL